MKHVINILVILILVGFAVGVTYMQAKYEGNWGILYLPTVIFMFLWGIKLDNDYNGK